MSLDLLQHSEVTVTQERRTDKVSHCCTESKQIKFKPKVS